MASIITATTTSGLTHSADNSGVLQLASGTGNLVTVPSVTGTAMVSGNMPAFSAYRSGTDQVISSATWTKVQCNSEDFDTNSNYDNSTNYRFTPTVAGYYQINISISSQASSGTISRTICAIYKNGSLYRRKGDMNGFFVVTGSEIVYCNGSTDYIEMYAYINTTSTAAISYSENSTAFSGAMVRTA